ncbi:hypothetical protein Leryth_003124 [Lithospermum erythrorhizon]|nr:hypothetical protein Leryth_003124 [Lithospermum erythrorhizon]
MRGQVLSKSCRVRTSHVYHDVFALTFPGFPCKENFVLHNVVGQFCLSYQACDEIYSPFLIGHVTKTGDIAGPRVLEHIVDVVLYMEGDKYSSHRLLRSVKNRFGSTRWGALELMLFSSNLWQAHMCALCVAGSSIMRQVNGVQTSRADMIISGVFINVISGVNVTETAGDLAVAAAICSSFLEFPLPSGIAFIGEIGLGGEIRSVPRMDKRIHTVTKLGYRKCVVPKSAEKCLSDIDIGGTEVVGCQNLKEMINKVFRKSSSTVR